MATPETESTVVPAPWHLEGRGYILLMRFDRAFAERCAARHPGLAGNANGGTGTVMVVDYETSGVGPYRELLLVPGTFTVAGRKRFAVTDILVSSRASVDSGRANWGLPKELARFNLHTVEDGSEHVTVARDGATFAELAFKRRWPPMPVTTALAPASWHTLLQPWDGRLFRTNISATGVVRPARLTEARIDNQVFPDFGSQRQLACLRVSRFSMTFPVAEITPMPA